jgi:hypothetical protein
MAETWDEMVEREGGYFLAGFTSGYDPDDVYYVAHCNHCGRLVNDEGDNVYTHPTIEGAKECWAARQQREEKVHGGD